MEYIDKDSAKYLGVINPYKMFKGIFISDWLFKLRISHTARFVYGYLSGCSGESGACFPSIDKISEYLNINKTSVKKSIKELKAYKLIETKRQKGKAGLTNEYTFHGWDYMLESLSNKGQKKVQKERLSSRSENYPIIKPENRPSHIKRKTIKEAIKGTSNEAPSITPSIEKEREKKKSTYVFSLERRTSKGPISVYENVEEFVNDFCRDLQEIDNELGDGLSIYGYFACFRKHHWTVQTLMKITVNAYLDRYFRENRNKTVNADYLIRRYTDKKLGRLLFGADILAASFLRLTGKFIDFRKKGKIKYPERVLIHAFEEYIDALGTWDAIEDRFVELFEDIHEDYWCEQDSITFSMFIDKSMEYIRG